MFALFHLLLNHKPSTITATGNGFLCVAAGGDISEPKGLPPAAKRLCPVEAFAHKKGGAPKGTPSLHKTHSRLANQLKRPHAVVAQTNRNDIYAICKHGKGSIA